MPSPFILKALGINTSPNQLDAPDGSLTVASNVVIQRDNVVQPRRGFKLYGDSFGTSTDRAKQLMEYRGRILRHYQSTLQFDTQVLNAQNESIFNSFAGSYSEVFPGLRIKSVEANKNFYFTTSDGIKKISAASADQFSTDPGYITNAGGVKALDISTRLAVDYGSSTGFLPVDAAVAYRVVWGIKDANDNIILGTPSSRSTIYNPLQQMVVRDYMQLLYGLDQLDTTGSYYNDGNYVSTLGLPLNATPQEIHDSMVDLTSKLDLERGTLFASADFNSGTIVGGLVTVKVDNLEGGFGKIADGDIIYLKDFTPVELNGPQTVTSVSTDGTDFIITFETTAADASLTAGSIESGSFRGITVPDSPNVPATHDDLAGLQTYLLNIITELQSDRNLNEVAKNDGVAEINPLEITTAAVTGTTTLTINFDVSVTNTDAQNQFQVGDLVVLEGTWTAFGAEDISGLQIVATVNTGNITLTLGSAVTNGAVTIDAVSTVQKVQRFTDELKTEFIEPLTITTTANVIVTINIPPNVTTNNFFQIYRSDIAIATGTDVLADLTPDDEMKLVYENFPTQAEIDDGVLEVEDVVPDSFIQGATNLYTNADSGEGILQANDVPPLASDIANFKNVTWYSNTKTRHREEIFLLGVTKIIQDYDNSLNPTIEIANETTKNSYRFVKGVNEVTDVTTVAGSALAASGPASYFLLNSANNVTQYYVWYAIGTATDPAISGKTGIEVFASAGDTNVQIAEKTRDRLNVDVDDFTAEISTGHTVRITCVDPGITTDASAGTSTFTINVITQGVGENITKETTVINCVAGNLYLTAGTADYFTLNTPFDRQLYAFWFNVTGGVMTAPVLSGRTVTPITVLTTDTNAQVAVKIRDAINTIGYWTATSNSNVITIISDTFGPTTNATEVVVNAGFTVSITTNGALDVLLSDSASPSIAVDETARSLVNAINRNERAEIVSAFYISDVSTTPGDILLEAQELQNVPFYVVTNQDGTGSSFNPDLSPSFIGLTNTAANPTVITANSHGLLNGDEVLIVGSNSFPLIDGIHTVAGVTTNTFTIPVNVLTPGNTGSFINIDDAQISNNEVRPNRIYYSKLQQPEAVPILNFLDVGSANKQILRIFALRDSLFVFKEEGLYRISGETPPWNLALFDQNTKLIAADSLSSSNNLIYCWGKQGILTVSEGGAQLISRPIDVDILPISTSSNYTNFSTATWGIGYDSDNAYYVYTVLTPEDLYANICYRYCNLTNTWTTFDKTNTCGIIKSTDDKLYMGAGDVNFLEVERKNFNRTDYADREYTLELEEGNYFQNGLLIKFPSTSNIEIGDVLVQEQTLSIYTYNQLLKKLDLDPQVHDADYFTTLEAEGGDNMRTKIEELASKLDADTGVSNIHTFLPAAVNTGTETITIASHGYSNNNVVRFSSTGTLPAGLNSTDYFYIINVSTNTFQISATQGGAALNITSQGTGVHTIKEVSYTYGIVARTNFPIQSNAVGNPTVVTSTNHGMLTGRLIVISSVADSRPTINGSHQVVDVDFNNFEVAVDVIGAGTGGTFTTDIQNFTDIMACYNIIITKLNADSGASFSNYQLITDTTAQEVFVVDVNQLTGIVTLSPLLQFVIGPMTLYKKIDSNFVYSNVTLGDPVGMKQISEATMMFEDKTFSEAILSFSTDLLPEFIDVPFSGLGNGIFGNDEFGQNFFGGNSHSAPFRTYIPRQCQRCRFLNIKFNHKTAREKFSVYGISLTGRIGLSSRAYR